MAREIGISKLHVFELTDANTATYEKATPVPWVVNIDVSKNIASYSAFADNIAEISSSRTTGAELTIEVSSDMSPELEAFLTGVKFEYGMLIEGADAKKPQFGLAYETLLSDGTVRRYFYTNCTISKNEQSNETVSDSVSPVTYSLTAQAVPLPVSKDLYFAMDEKDYENALLDNAGNQDALDAITIQWENWFEDAPKRIELP